MCKEVRGAPRSVLFGLALKMGKLYPTDFTVTFTTILLCEALWSAVVALNLLYK